jgi:YVTN family beta-propeller protein
MKITGLFTIIFFVSLLVSCEKSTNNLDPDTLEGALQGGGAFIVNEGNFRSGNGSVSFYSYQSGKIFNDIFSGANSRPLGDVPNSMVVNGNNGYIIVNNSGNIEVVDIRNLKSQKTITGLNSPRNMLIVNNEKAYVSSLYSNSLSIVNLTTNSMAGSISMRRSSEAMVIANNKAFISSWYNGKDIMVINTVTDKVIDSIQVAPEPESMVVDQNQKLWVLCSGGYTGQVHAELVRINPVTDVVEKEFVFPAKSSYPTCLQINKTRDTLYYVDNGIWKMSIQAGSLPSTAFVKPSSRFIYKLAVDTRYNRIFYTDAMDYVQKGYIVQVNPKGTQIDSCRAEIIPGSICFK